MGRRTRGKGAYGLIKARYIKNRSAKTGKAVTGNVKRVIFYNVYGNKQNNPERRQRGFIYDQTGNLVRYGDYKAWAVGKAINHLYTYRLIISPKGQGLLDDADFVTAVTATHEQQDYAVEFQMVVHRDTAHTHAHLLFHTDKTMSKKALEAYKETLRLQLMTLEENRAKAKGLSVPKVGTEDEPISTNSNKATSTKPRRRRRRRRAKNKSKSKSQGLDEGL